ncbi:hypothetical protein SODALDRAFT_44809 [Sodiomyces alkalinus F11]|uniref:Uncharacterized protein n=1 Tax=Sodiomyces alkalinus (strain CBS 110278 / VKM F-3762 / F11) TaxID=1314773 RepID=A0A3N2QA95_SODAK|nr:hypothetical protein SODALDRAFT_44809 [Sodiomyces alkalinus F11]ROT43694.1 hypothetical protein SODALDRAFT_44809 [Sodiomyces alkalinus F11]
MTSTVTLATGLGASSDGERWAVPMTEPWTAPSGCSTIVPWNAGEGAGYHETCAPPAWTEAWYYDGYYSPGVCPSDYTVGCTKTSGSVNFEDILAEQTAAACVPKWVTPFFFFFLLFSSFFFFFLLFFVLFFVFFSSSLVVPLLTIPSITSQLTTPLFSSRNFACSEDTSGITFWATMSYTVNDDVWTTTVPAIQIRWRPEDLDILAVHPLSGAISAASSSIPSRSRSGSGNSPSDQPESSSDGGGISTGAIIGIVVGVVGGLALIGIGAFFLLKRRGKNTPKTGKPSGPGGAAATGTGFAPQPSYSPVPMKETHGSARVHSYTQQVPSATTSPSPMVNAAGYYAPQAQQPYPPQPGYSPQQHYTQTQQQQSPPMAYAASPPLQQQQPQQPVYEMAVQDNKPVSELAGSGTPFEISELPSGPADAGGSAVSPHTTAPVSGSVSPR